MGRSARLTDTTISICLPASRTLRSKSTTLGTEPNLRSLTQVLEKADAQQLQSVANRVIVVGRNVQTVISKNKALIENELEYVNGTMAMVAKAAADQQGPYSQAVVSSNLVMNQVA